MRSRGNPLPAAVPRHGAAAPPRAAAPALIAPAGLIGLVLLTCLTAAGCGVPAAGPAATVTATTSAVAPGPSTAAPATTITVRVGAGRASTAGRRFKVRRGDTVRVTVTGDRADELHLHGYDRSARLAPGRAATIDLVADLPGVFEAELHESGIRLFELQVG